MKLDALHQNMRDLFVAELKVAITTGSIPEAMEREVDDLLNTCPVGEYCDQCGDIFCPWGESLHFHHDGCPCCASEPDPPTDRAARHAERMKRWKALLKRNQQT